TPELQKTGESILSKATKKGNSTKTIMTTSSAESSQQKTTWEDPGTKMAKRLAELTVAENYSQLRRLATTGNCRCRTRNEGRTPLMLAAQVGRATSWRYAKCIDLLLDRGASARATDKATGDTAAHLAARTGNLRLLSALPYEDSSGSPVKFAVNGEGRTPLMEAAEAGSWECARHLLHLLRQRRRREKRKSLLNLKDKKGCTAADLAEAAGHPELAEVIRIEIRGLTFKEKQEAQELMRLANRAPPAEFLRLATRVNCDWPHLQWFHTCLSCLARRSAESSACLDSLRQLVDELRADATSSNTAGWTALHAAAGAGATEAVRLLVDAGAWVNCPDGDGGTALMEAAAAGKVETAQVLLELGANWQLKNANGETAESIAAKGGNAELMKLMQSFQGKDFFSTDVEPSQSTQLESDDIASGEEDGDFDREVAADSFNQGEPHANTGLASSRSSRLRYRAADFYPVTDPQGICLVININKYSPSSKFECRDGSELDVQRIRQLFERLRFRVLVRQDLSVNGVLNCLHEVANNQAELQNHGCFVCFLMAHGTADSIYGCDGRPLEIKYLAARFQANICSGLEHKPKIFFVQACRGGRTEATGGAGAGSQLLSQVQPVSTDSTSGPAPVKDSLFCPTESDFLFCYANTETGAAYREPHRGSIFIQTLCTVLEREYQREHLVDIMTQVNRRVKENPVRCPGRQLFYHSVPEMRSQLSKKVSLDPSWAAK
ncbi:hypothetical protein BOX15_Mlig000705g2, partial [Macrostomum lignano]